MGKVSSTIEAKTYEHVVVPLANQRKKWAGEFAKTYAVLVVVYAGFYLLRTNFKSAQPFLVEQVGLTTTQLGTIGFGFSLVYGFGGLFLGLFLDGRNTKKAISVLLVASGVIAIAIGVMLLTMGASVGFFLVLWSLNGLFQAPGGPCCNSTMNRWTPRKYRGRFIGWWNASHNIGAMIAGALALWGANFFFGGNVAGMFIVPAIVAIPIGIWGYFFGKDDPRELGWDVPEKIFDEPMSKADVVTVNESKGAILVKYVLRNPAVWLLCIANVAAYCVRIGIDNWNVLYARQELGFSDYTAINTTVAFEIGGLLGSLAWGYFSDKIGGRRGLAAAIGMGAAIIPVLIYANATSVAVVYVSLGLIGFLIFGPVTLIGIAVIGFAPKTATVVVNAVPRAFGYIFGDSMAKIFLGRIADPTKDGVDVLGIHLQGWGSTFTVMVFSAVVGLVCLIGVALLEERMMRADKKFTDELSASEKKQEELAQLEEEKF